MENSTEQASKQAVNKLKIIFGEKKDNFNSKLKIYSDFSQKKVQKNLEKYFGPLKFKNDKLFYIVKFNLNPENDEKQNQEYLKEFQKLIKNLFVTLKAVNKKAKEYIKNVTITTERVKNSFCIGISVSKDWEDMILAGYEGIQLSTSIELSDIDKRLLGTVSFEKGVNQILEESGENLTIRNAFSILENIQIESKLAISMNEVLNLIKKSPIKYQKIQEKLYPVIYFMQKMKQNNLEMELEKINEQDIEEIMGLDQEEQQKKIDQIKLPWKINILPKIINLFSKAFTTEVELICNVDKVAFKAALSTDQLTNVIDRIIEYK
ncbi:hypothetical protein PPERSA_01271 [Pseudocohnilembus persalinus]|uniref:Uncharacterized protein n=1 Tax=Pseudocohnilembus persalinus TaxID=266149 RepID=A0A0V0QGU6_PSEPJ|nr:hypothetical protein PPERSA_01271 [Pseudocohnilembus persalinus]|eukprot:KRX01368.1 hypothetical protein PPERSA_01271 [Pseudocohnilembus persalinus]